MKDVTGDVAMNVDVESKGLKLLNFSIKSKMSVPRSILDVLPPIDLYNKKYLTKWKQNDAQLRKPSSLISKFWQRKGLLKNYALQNLNFNKL